MGVGVVIDPANHSPRHREPVPADGKSIHAHHRFQFRDPPQVEMRGSFEKGGVFHFQHRQVTVVRHVFYPGGIPPRVRLPLHRDVARPTDDVRVGNDLFSGHDKTRAST